MSKSASLPKTALPIGDLLFWADTQFLQTKTEQEEINAIVTDIREDTWKVIKREDVGKIEEILKQGAPFPKSVFDKVAKDIRREFLLQPFRFSLQGFAQACLYSKRYHELVSNLPDELYQCILKESKETKYWEEIYNKKSTIYKKQLKKYQGLYLREKFVIQAPLRDVADFAWYPTTDPTMKQVTRIEQVGDCGEVLHLVSAKGFAGLTKPKDYVLAVFRKEIDENTCVHLACSIEHKTIPITDKHNRVKMETAAYIISKVEKGTEVISIWQIDLSGESFSSKMTSTDAMIPKTFSCYKAFKSLEKAKK
eukprot:TRINITY_DN7932_c0_g1_i1.p1 TRINITY_DN7932_c0_g1~~TRINITY_DN7932_c0_g1_i1.p1  ORF type:complete len:309 (-),score=76.62 TRINITY_DN7932_c0_g1_i1:39-965(-)